MITKEENEMSSVAQLDFLKEEKRFFVVVRWKRKRSFTRVITWRWGSFAGPARTTCLSALIIGCLFDFIERWVWLRARREPANEDNELVSGESSRRSKTSSSSEFDRFDDVFGLSKLMFIRLPPNNAAGRVGRAIGIVALEFNEVNES